MKSFDVSFDYLCPFAKNIHLHLVAALRAGADYDVRFVPWTLRQAHRAEGALDVWDDPQFDHDLLALASAVSVRDEQPERFLDAHEALFQARHEDGVRLTSFEEITRVLAPLGVDVEAVRHDVATRRPHKEIKASHEGFARYEAFGVPTFVLDDDATFVRYMTGPSGDGRASIEVIDSLLGLMGRRELNEFKRTRLPQ
jgi:2-hydroxychromene-2-carboxylate isomerase